MPLKSRNTFSVFIKKVAVIITLLPFFILPFEQMVWAVESSVIHGSTALKMASVPGGSTNHVSIPETASMAKSWQGYRLPRKKMISPLTSLPVMANGESALSSNASNFHGAWNASVDPRTGSSSLRVTLASTLFNKGESKRDLKLSYVGGPSARGADTFDLGPHWQWNIGHEHPGATEVEGHLTTAVTPGDGHGFTMVSDRDSNGRTLWRPLRHKLHDVKITGHPGDWIISEATGVRQRILNGYEQWEESISGQRVYFYYNKQGASDITRHLTYICAHELTIEEQQSDTNACKNDGIHISYQGSNVIVQSYQTIMLHRINNSGIQMINKIIMPPLSSPGVDNAKNATIELTYDNRSRRPWLLSRVDYPTGLSKTFLYNGESNHPGVQTAGLSAGVNGAHIPVVTEEISESTKTGAYKIPAVRIWYRYSVPENGSQEHNYLGYQGPHSVIPGRDNLFDRHHSYTYSVMKDNGLTYTTITFNKYHLPLTITERDSRNHTMLALSRQDYLPWRGTVFSELPASYSMTDRETKSAYMLTEKGHDALTAPALIIDSKKYNQEGNVIWKKDAYGRVTVTEYCPPEGDEHCPAMDRSWPQMNLPEKVLALPAKKSPEGSVPFLTMAARSMPEMAMETVYDYVRMQAVPNRKRSYEGAGLSDKKPSSFLKVSTKTEGTLSVTDLDFYHRDYYDNNTHYKNNTHHKNNSYYSNNSHYNNSHYSNNSNPDKRQFPEITHVSLKTTYGYNTDINDAAYAQLNQMTMAKSSETRPRINNKLLHRGPIFSAHQRFENNASEEVVSFAVDEHFDADHGTHTKALRIIPEQSTPHAAGAFKALDHGAGLQLGTTVYALDTGVKLSHEDTLGEIRTLWHYDSWHRPVEEIAQPRKGGRARVIKWTYIFTPEENAVVKTLPDGQQLKAVLSADDKVLSTWHRFAGGANTTVRGTGGWIADTALTYTASGKVAEKTTWHAGDMQPDGSESRAIALKTRYGYDRLNRLVWTQQPGGMVDVAVRDDPAMRIFNYQVIPATKEHPEQLGSAIKVLETNILNKQTASYLLPLDPAVNKSGKPLYSKQLQLQLIKLKQQLLSTDTLQQQNSYGLLPVAGNTGLLSFVTAALKAHGWMRHIRWKYDGYGRKTEQISGNGATTLWHYDRDNLVATTLPDGRIIHDEFNVHNEKTIRCVQPSGASECHVLGVKGYDYHGQLAWQADEYGRVIHYTYDDNGRLLKETLPPVKGSPTGHVITYKYNSIGVTEKDLDGQPYLFRRYDPDTWKLTDTEDAISHVHYTYDKQSGLPIRITHSKPEILHSPINYPSYVEETVYDRYLMPVKSRDGSGNIYTAMHDNLGRVIATFVQLPAMHQPMLLMRQDYDAFNRVSTITNGIGIKRVLMYNSLGELQSIRDSRAGLFLDKISYAYDPDTSNILTLTREEGDEAAVQHYTYDLSNNLTAMTCHAGGKENKASALCPRDTDIKGSHLTGAPVITGQKYIFDHWNNIQTVEESGVRDLVSAAPYTKTTHYHYAVSGTGKHPGAYDPNRLLGYQTQWDKQRYSSTPENITYDEAGRIIKDADGNLLGYNAFGQQNHFVNAATGEITEYTYDSQGHHQVAEQSFTRDHRALQAPLYMLYKGNAIAAQVQRGKDNKLHISSEAGGIAHSEDGVITRWYLHNYKGDVLACFDNHGVRKSSNIYSPYGMKYDRDMKYDKLNIDKQILPLRLSISGQQPWWQSHQPGFNSQMSDPATGYQFLGGGYRAYNPVYRRFMAKDSFSPFIKVDGYGYGDNNPIMNTDPSGHMSRSWRNAIEGISVAAGFLVGVFTPVAMGLISYGLLTITAFPGSYVGLVAGTSLMSSIGIGLNNTLAGCMNLVLADDPKSASQNIVATMFDVTNIGLFGALGGSAMIGATAIMISTPAITAFDILAHGLGFLSGASIFSTAGVMAGQISVMKEDDFSQNGKIGKKYESLEIATLALMAFSLIMDTAAMGIKGIELLSGYGVGESKLQSDEGTIHIKGRKRYNVYNGLGSVKISYTEEGLAKRPNDSDRALLFDGWFHYDKPTSGSLYFSSGNLYNHYEGEVSKEYAPFGKGIMYMHNGEAMEGKWSENGSYTSNEKKSCECGESSVILEALGQFTAGLLYFCCMFGVAMMK